MKENGRDSASYRLPLSGVWYPVPTKGPIKYWSLQKIPLCNPLHSLVLHGHHLRILPKTLKFLKLFPKCQSDVCTNEYVEGLLGINEITSVRGWAKASAIVCENLTLLKMSSCYSEQLARLLAGFSSNSDLSIWRNKWHPMRANYLQVQCMAGNETEQPNLFHVAAPM